MFGLKSRRERKQVVDPNADYSKVFLQKTYVLEELLGQGTNAKVHKAKDKKGRLVAVKIMKTKGEIEQENGQQGFIDEEKLFRHEIDVMVKIKERLPKHPNILELIKVCMSDDPQAPPARPCLVLEYLPGGELFDKIVEKSYYTEADAADLFYKLMITLRDLHAVGVVHRDLKPENIIFGSNDNIIKICDFGTAKLMDESESDIFADYKVGSPGYFAPETIYKNYHPANDVWSMGCILYTLLAGYMPFDMDDPLLIVKLMTCKYEFHEENWKNISGDAKDLISKMLSIPYNERITAEEVLKHGWFSKMKRRPSQANLGQTLIKLKELNDDKEKKRQHMREYFFQNVLAARSKMTDLIQGSRKVGASAIRSIRSRGLSMSNSFRSKQSKNIQLNHTKPKNRQDLLSDIRQTHGGFQEQQIPSSASDDSEEEEEEEVERNRSKSTLKAITGTVLKAVGRRRKPKNRQELLSDIRTRNAGPKSRKFQAGKTTPNIMEIDVSAMNKEV